MTRLGEVATYINGFAFAPEDWSENGLPIIRIQDLTGNSYQMNRYAGEYNPKYEVNRGDVLISWSASLGVYVWQGERALLNQHIFKVVFDKCEVDKSFYVHQVADILEKAASQAHGATMKHLTKPVFDALPFYLPDLPTQRRIADTLDKVSEGIGLCRKMLGELDLMVKAKFVEMFENENYPHTELINLIKDGMGLSYGIVQPGDDGTGEMGVLRPVDMVGGKISMTSIKYIDRSIGDGFRKTELTGDELLITVRGTTGVTALTDARFTGMNVTRGIAVIRYDREKINPVYLNAYLNTDESQRYIQEHTRGATLQQINLSDLRIQDIVVPPINLQNRFAAFIAEVDKSKLTVQRIRDKMEMEKLALMQKYFA
ncbi:MAG: restriction endonuclease subunit S [Lachnospiraceae bacterium]